MGSFLSSVALAVPLVLWPAGWLLARGLAARPLSAGGARDWRAEELSIVIPARDEEHNLPRLLASLGAGKPGAPEVIVVDDASGDGTAAVAREHGARVLAAGDLPDGWRGKPHACQRGAEQARGRLLLFLDADTWFEPGGLERLLRGFRGGALSILPWHETGSAVERLSAVFNIIMAAGTAPHGLFGQMLLIEREAYLAVDGHQRVRDRILEHWRLAGHLRTAGLAVEGRVEPGILRMRMYPGGLREMVEGWTKGFASGAGQVPRITLVFVSAWLGGMISACIACLFTPWGLLAYLLHAFAFHLLARRVGNFGYLTALVFPLPLIFYLAVFMRSLRRSGREVTWKGRRIHGD